MKNKRSGQVEIQNYSDSLGLALNISSKTIKPDPIPIDVKVVMIGDSRLFTLLSMYEDNFANIFKVKAEFDYESEISGDTIRDYISRMQSLIKKENLRPLDKSGTN